MPKSPKPGFFEPLKATLVDIPFSAPNWIYERKLDGVRALAFRDGAEVRLMSRTGRSMNNTYPELVDALGDEPCDDFIADGEIVAFSRGITSFSKLQGRIGISDPDAARRSGIRVYLYVFDLVWVDGDDLRPRRLRERKRLLRDALEFGGDIRYTPHRNEHGEQLFREACRKGLEGLIAKRADGAYVHGRSRDWLKFKCAHEQEFVIGGYTAPQGSRSDFGALRVGYYEQGKLRYAGKVGTGFNRQTLERLGARLRARGQPEPPFVDVHPVPRGTHWVRPELVAQVAFSEWTRGGRLRHPRFLGLRDDKPAEEVVREEPG